MGLEKYFYIGALLVLIGSCVMMNMGEKEAEQEYVPQVVDVPQEPAEQVQAEPEIVENTTEVEIIEEPAAEPGEVVYSEYVDFSIKDYESMCEVGKSDARLVEENVGSSLTRYYELPDGKKVGPYYKWLENGQIRSFRCYNEDGEKNGPVVDWDENGNKNYEYFYVDDVFNGSYRRWTDGVMTEEKFYSHGLLNGSRRLWYEDGTLREEEFYLNGIKHLAWKTYFENGQLKDVYHYDDGMKLPDYSVFYEDGSLQSQKKGELDSGRFTGYILTFGKPENGMQEGTRCEYVDDEQTGCEEVTQAVA